MFGITRHSNPFDQLFNFHREVDRLFNSMWGDLSARTAPAVAPGFQVRSTDDAWQVAVPMPGIDPAHVSLEVAGNTLRISAGQGGDEGYYGRFEQTLTVPAFVDLDKVKASHRHGLLELTLPFKDAVKPRRIQIETQASDAKQLTAVA